MALFSSKTHLLFIGDSITAGGRSVISPLGNGFVAKIAHELHKTRPELKISNRGIGGNTTKNLAKRWKNDCLSLKPSLISILIGINDTWRRYDQGIETTLMDFEEYYRNMLDRAFAASNATIILCEPFLLPLSDEQKLWHIDLDPKRRLIKGLSEEYRLQLLPLHSLFKKAAESGDPRSLTEDGVHPTDEGHRLIADAWLQTVMPSLEQVQAIT
jgi:acyl-CoA thioesterase I